MNPLSFLLTSLYSDCLVYYPSSEFYLKDVEAILAEILAKEAEAVAVAEYHDVQRPSPRAAFTMVSNPGNEDELIFFGGEHYTGDRGTFYNDLFVFNVAKRSWSRYDSPNRPPPRSSHAVAVHKTFMYIFGGEFSNPSLSQYRHYRDLWRLDVETMSWERIETRGGPTARSGHRMCVVCNKLLVFGGFFDTGFDNKYLNDCYYVDLTLDELKWTRVETSAADVVPSPRSGFQWVADGSDVFLLGGYCKETVQKAKTVSHKGKKKGGAAVEESMVSRGVVLSDTYKLSGDTLKWQKVKRAGYGPSRRAGFSLVLHKHNAVLFGGVEDEETDEDLQSTFFNDMFGFSTERKKWFPLNIRGKKQKKARRRRRKHERDTVGQAMSSSEGNPEGAEELHTSTNVQVEEKDIEVDTDEEEDENELDTDVLEEAMMKQKEEQAPCGRFNAALAISKNFMFIAGGVVEKGDQEVTLDDIWSVDLNKLEEFRELLELSEQSAMWVESEEEDVEEEETGIEGEEDEDNDGENSEKHLPGERKQLRGNRRELLRERISETVEESSTPRVNESLKDFFERTKPYWIGEVHEALGESGKTLRRMAFEWAFRRYWEIKPTLKELEELEAELAREEELEKEFEKAQIEQKRARSRR